RPGLVRLATQYGPDRAGRQVDRTRESKVRVPRLVDGTRAWKDCIHDDDLLLETRAGDPCSTPMSPSQKNRRLRTSAHEPRASGRRHAHRTRPGYCATRRGAVIV